jgi:hypothetical protein
VIIFAEALSSPRAPARRPRHTLLRRPSNRGTLKVRWCFCFDEGRHAPSWRGLKKPSHLVGEGSGRGVFHRRPLRDNAGMIGPVWRPQLLITPVRGSCRAVCTPGSRKASWPEIVQGPLAFRVYCVPTRMSAAASCFPSKISFCTFELPPFEQSRRVPTSSILYICDESSKTVGDISQN